LHSSAQQVQRLRDLAGRVTREAADGTDHSEVIDRVEATRKAYREALDDDLNLPQGMGAVFELVREVNAALDDGRVGRRTEAALLGLLGDVDAHLDVLHVDDAALAVEVEKLIAERETARRDRDFATADRIRTELRDRGIQLEDSKDGVRWKRVAPSGVERS
jgi:cysteinyl-tRNA synthetase